MAQITNDWDAALRPEYKKPYYRDLYNRIVEEYKTHIIYPPSEEIFTAFLLIFSPRVSFRYRETSRFCP